MLCKCGCGQTTTLATRDDKRWNCVKGKHRDYCVGHGGPKTLANGTMRDLYLARIEPKLVARENGCFFFIGTLNHHGYGILRWSKMGVARNYLAHRVTYEAAHGPIPTGMLVLHSCDNPACCNIRHLRLGSHQDNMNDVRDRRRGTIGVTPRSAKVDEPAVRDIRRRHAEGGHLRELAREYGITYSTARAITTRQTWKHVT